MKPDTALGMSEHCASRGVLACHRSKHPRRQQETEILWKLVGTTERLAISISVVNNKCSHVSLEENKAFSTITH